MIVFLDLFPSVLGFSVNLPTGRPTVSPRPTLVPLGTRAHERHGVEGALGHREDDHLSVISEDLGGSRIVSSRI